MNMKLFTVMWILLLFVSLPAAQAVSISNVRTTDVTDKSAVIRWDTDDPADSTVNYGVDTNNLMSVASNFNLVTDHAIALTGLDAGETYFFSVRSADNETFDEDNAGGNNFAFSTAAVDTFPPRIAVELPSVVNEGRISISGETEVGTDLRLYHNNVLIRQDIANNGVINFPNVVLVDGQVNILRIDAVDVAGNPNSASFNVAVDLVSPELTVDRVGAVKKTADVVLNGTVSEIALVTILLDEEELFSEEVSSFTLPTSLNEGRNTITITAVDAAGNSDEVEIVTTVDTEVPVIESISPFDEVPFYYEGRAEDKVEGVTEANADVYMFIQGIFVVDQTGPQPDIDEIIEKAQFKTTSDGQGNFKFDDVDFEHPGFGLQEVEPREVQPGTEGLVGTGALANANQDVQTTQVWVVVVDKVGLNVVEGYSVDIGSCFAGSFDFSVTSVPRYQMPNQLSPFRLESGNEMISFVMGLDYRGRAENNRRDPRAERADENYYEINDVELEAACSDVRFLNRNPQYEEACRLLPKSGSFGKSINVERTNWYFQYKLGESDDFSDFSDDVLDSLVNNELKFPFKITINYEEKLPGKVVTNDGQQVLCRDVSYFVDVPVDPREVLPDFLLEEGQALAESTIELIDEILPTLEQVIQYAGIGYMGSFALRTIVQIYRRFVEKWEYLQCKGPVAAGTGDCPLTDFDQLDQCFYIDDPGDSPYPGGAPLPKDSFECAKIKDDLQGTNIRRNLEESTAGAYFSATIGAWKAEEQLYKAGRWLGDRVFCHAAPAKWTQTAEVFEIQQKVYEQQQCATDSSSVRTLQPVQNCYETLKEKQNVLDTSLIVTRSDLVLGEDTCYSLGAAIYRISPTESAQCTGSTTLQRIDIKQKLAKQGTFESTPRTLCAVQEGNTYYTADARKCDAVCKSAGNEWVGACLVNDDAERGAYPMGPTSDCWEGSITEETGKQCFCTKEDKTDVTKGKITARGATYADAELAGDGSGDKLWPWSYREWQIYEARGGKGGIYYPPERYYEGRDLSAAFGQNHLLDYIKGKNDIPAVDPFTGHIDAFQSVCLTGIRGRLLLLQSVLKGFQNCLEQVKTTGRADAGVCHEFFSQFACNLAYKAFALFQDKCVPQPFSAQIEKEEPSVKTALKYGSSAITDTMSSMAHELEGEYGNAQLNQYFEGGSQAFMKRVCLAAFGVESGFDYNTFLDAAYTVPFKTSALVVSSEGAVGRREFLGFNPQNKQSIYEYRAGWTIFPGCDLESYGVDLAAVTEREVRQFTSIDCSAVGNKEFQSNGCDNLRGSHEQTRPFFGGGHVTQGVYVDEHGSTNIESDYRYDHFKLTLNLDPRWEASTCFPPENVVGGNSAVFYFPIADATTRDLFQCDVSVSSGQFFCAVSDLDELGQAWIEDVQCWDPDTGDYRQCNRVTLTRVDNDPVRAQIGVFTSGQNKMCLLSHVQTQNDGRYPETKAWYPIPGIGRPGVMPVTIDYTTVDEENFKGTEATGGIRPVDRGVATDPLCTFERGEAEVRQDAPVNQRTGGRTEFVFSSSGPGKYQLRVEPGKVSLVGEAYQLTPEGHVQTKTTTPTTAFTITELGAITYRVNGYGIKGVAPSGSAIGACRFETQPPTDRVARDQVWTLHARVYYPDENNECSEGSVPVPDDPTLGFDTLKNVEIRVSETEVSSVRQTAFDQGIRFYNAGQSGEVRARALALRDAISHLHTVWADAPEEGDAMQFLAFYYSAIAYKQLYDPETVASQKDQWKVELLGITAAVGRRIDTSAVQGNTHMIGLPEVQLAVAYLDKLEGMFNDNQINFDLIKRNAPGACDDCSKIEQAWERVAVTGNRGYYNPGTGTWVGARVYSVSTVSLSGTPSGTSGSATTPAGGVSGLPLPSTGSSAGSSTGGSGTAGSAGAPVAGGSVDYSGSGPPVDSSTGGSAVILLPNIVYASNDGTFWRVYNQLLQRFDTLDYQWHTSSLAQSVVLTPASVETLFLNPGVYSTENGVVYGYDNTDVYTPGTGFYGQVVWVKLERETVFVNGNKFDVGGISRNAYLLESKTNFN